MTVSNKLGLRIIDNHSCMATNWRGTTVGTLMSRVIIDMDLYPPFAKAVMVFNGGNDQDSGQAICTMYDSGGTAVTGASITLDTLVWAFFQVKKTSAFDLSGKDSYYFQLTGEDDVLAKVEIWIVLE